MNDVLDALKGSLGEVTMSATADDIVAAGRTRRRHRRLAGVAAGAVAVAALGAALTYGNAPPPTGEVGGVHIHTVGYTVDTMSDGTVHVTIDKHRYAVDHAGVEAALRRAGMPVVMKEGEFCRGPQDDGWVNSSGTGRGVDRVVKGESGSKGRTNLIFTPSALPPGKQLFIGYLNEAQLAVTGGHPGSIERLVPLTGPLTCTTQLPTGH